LLRRMVSRGALLSLLAAFCAGSDSCIT
jgi:hypothetical protein